ncbi:GDSL-type esterase/lipase family protein [uncultured Oscillibacter sp.]|uniref:GDSL-type esterase/lipase family protein n=1 Tax=uncultured Oscillibacter sp. TaxID=876091 RepID=UPI00262A8C5A|nr:GDSL-type esterase/lipase family protein [uncultured Oscillibacter sp.]
MEGKRERVRRRRLPGVMAALAAATLLLTTGASGGTAVSSPLAEAAEPVPYKAAPAAGKIGTGTEARAKALPEETESLPCPLPETEAVEDTYFDGAVFLGDSRTEGLSLYSGLKTGYFYTAVGATVESVFSKKNFETEDGEKVPLLDAVAEQDCDKIYIMLGINELGWSKVKTFHDQYAKLVDRVRADHPEAKIVLQSIPPVSAKQEAKKTYVNNARIAEYNGVIQALAEEKECYFLDVAACLTGGDGLLPKDLNFDGIHLNPAGCKVWLNYLRTHSLEEEAIAAAMKKD